MGLFGKKESSHDANQNEQIKELTANLNTAWKWLKTYETWFQNVFQRIGNLEGVDKQHDALFKSMQETDAKMKVVIDALQGVAKKETVGA